MSYGFVGSSGCRRRGRVSPFAEGELERKGKRAMDEWVGQHGYPSANQIDAAQRMGSVTC